MFICIFILFIISTSTVSAGSLIAIGQFSNAGKLQTESGLGHYNGWYWDSNYGLQLKSGAILSVCSTGTSLIFGGNFSFYHPSGYYVFNLLQSNGAYFNSIDIPNPVDPYDSYGGIPDSEEEQDEQDDDIEGDTDGGSWDDGGNTDSVDDGFHPDGVVEEGFVEELSIEQRLKKNSYLKTSTKKSFVNVVPTFPNGPVTSLFCSSDYVAFGGTFSSAGDVPLSNIGTYDFKLKTWISLDGGILGEVKSIFSTDDNIYVGGLFNSTGYSLASNIASYSISESNWNNLGEGVNGVVNAIYAVTDSEVYVGGNFTSAFNWEGAIDVPGLALWDSQEWASYGEIRGIIRAMTYDKKHLYVAGNVTIDGINFGIVADATTNTILTGISGTVNDMSFFDKKLVVVGDLILENNKERVYVAFYRDNKWQAIYSDVNGPVVGIVTGEVSEYGMIGSGATLLGLFCLSLLCLCQDARNKRTVRIPSKKNEELTPLHKQDPPTAHPIAVSLLYNSRILLLFLAISTIMNIITLVFASKEKNLQIVDFLFTSHIWKPIVRIDVCIGVSIIIPTFHVLVNFASVATHTPKDGDIKSSLSFTIRGKIMILLSLLIWGVIYTAYYYSIPLPLSLEGESIFITIGILVVKKVASILLNRAINMKNPRDVKMSIIYDTLSHILSSICTSTVLGINPKVKVVSVFIPVVGFLIDFAFSITRHVLIVKKIQSEKLPFKIFQKIVSYNVDPLINGNKQAADATKRLFFRIVDFSIYSGYSPILAPILMIIVTIDIITFHFLSKRYQTNLSSKSISETKCSVFPIIMYVSVIGGGLYVSIPVNPTIAPIFSLVLTGLLILLSTLPLLQWYVFGNIAIFFASLGLGIAGFLSSSSFTSRISLSAWFFFASLTFLVSFLRNCCK